MSNKLCENVVFTHSNRNKTKKKHGKEVITIKNKQTKNIYRNELSAEMALT